MSTNERVLPNQLDLEQIWLRVATDIKVRKFENLDDIPEFHELPDQLQNQLKNSVTGLNGGHETFHNEQQLTDFHAILFSKEKEKYVAIYEEKKPSEQIRSLLTTVGLTGVFFFLWTLLSKSFNTNTSQQLTDTDQVPRAIDNPTNNVNAASWNWSDLLTYISSVIPSAFAYPLFRRWFSAQDSAYNKLIEGCMLKKLDSISNSQ